MLLVAVNGINRSLGLIASVGKGGSDGDIELVEGLVKMYIERPSCIILLTVACESKSLLPPTV